MQKNTTDRQLRTDNAALNLVELLDAHADDLGLTDAQLYFEFPILKDLEGVVVISKVLIVSREHGIVAISTENTATPDSLYRELKGLDEELDHLFSLLFSRLVRNKALRKSKTELAFPTNTAIYAPFVSADVHNTHTESLVIFTARQILDFFNRIRIASLDLALYEELVATVEGAKGLIRPKARDVDTTDVNSKGRLANMVEAEIASFDQRQKLGYMAVLDGLQRIRGLAGSGKTVVLAMKAALTHMRNPESHILYTFYTKSLYQHIRRLITRFYRQFEDKDPDWNYLKVMHAWGGYNNEGVLFNACKSHDVEPLTYSDAYKGSSVDPFGYACRRFLNTVKRTSFVFPTYEYVFIDEGQDFPAAFIELCIDLTVNNRVVFAYDDLQTIFQARTPSIGEIVGTDVEGNPLVELTEDIVLYKCYRNPREIIVCARLRVWHIQFPHSSDA
jgi:superfamily I DNA and RNA helicase